MQVESGFDSSCVCKSSSDGFYLLGEVARQDHQLRVNMRKV